MKATVKYQLELFWLALSFFSRLPVPADVPYSEQRMNQAGRYFSLVGVLLGLLCALCYLWLSLWLPVSVAVIVTMTFSLLLTGAFHEDGLTDMADGVGGGMTTESRLTIMKDSRIGTYGAATLCLALVGKFVLLSELAAVLPMLMVWIMAYSLSRAVAASLIYDLPYVSDTDTSKSKPLASRQSKRELILLLLIGLIPLIAFSPLTILTVILVMVVVRYSFKSWLLSRLGGFTGDCLGALQQLAELAIYFILVALAHNGWLVMGGIA